MKAKFIILILSLHLCGGIAQSFDFYAAAGPVVSQIDGDRIGGYNKAGIMLGMGVKRLVYHKTHLTLEIDYIQKGKGVFNPSDNSSYQTILNYIDLPFLAHYSINERYSIQAGISVAALVSYKFLYNGEENEAPSYTPNNYDIDYVLGASYHLNEQWSVDLRLAQSIFAMGDKIPNDSYSPNIWTNPGAMYNRSLCLALVYNIE